MFSNSEMDIAVTSMDKDRDDQYLAGQNGVTKPIEGIASVKKQDFKGKLDASYELASTLDGFNNADRHSADYSGLNYYELKQHIKLKSAPDEFQIFQAPGSKDVEITLGRSHSSANTTSHSALSSSVAMSKDTMKL